MARNEHRAALPTLSVGIGANPQFDPSKIAASGGQINFAYTIAYAALTHATPGGKIEPELATSWKYVKTKAGPNKEFQVTLRHDAKFSDGTPVNATAVAAWLSYFPQGNSIYSTLLGPKPVFTAVGQWTVDFKLQTPTPNLPFILSDAGYMWGFVGSPAAVANPSSFASAPSGAGPYMLDASQSVVGDHLVYVPNPYYYDKSKLVYGQVNVKIITVATSMLQALQAGQLDMAYGDPSTAQSAVSAGFKYQWASFGTWVAELQATGQAVPALADVRVRQALNYAVDRKTMASAIAFGFAKPSSEIVSADAAEKKYEDYYPYDPSKAKSLLAAAGYSNGLTLTGVGVLTGTANAGIQQALANYWAAVGVTVNLVPFTGLSQLRSSALSIGIAPAYRATPALYGSYINPTGLLNWWGTDQTVLKLYFKGLKASDPTPIWQEMWGRMTERAYFVPIYSIPAIWYFQKGVAGVVVTKARLGAPQMMELHPAT